MKTHKTARQLILKVAFAAVVLVPRFAHSGVDITTSNFVPGNFTSASGYQNNVPGAVCFVAGQQNFIQGSYNGLFGFNSIVQPNAIGNFASGGGHSIAGNFNTALGFINTTNTTSVGSVVSGFKNAAGGNYSLLHGVFLSDGNLPGSVMLSDANPFGLRSATALRTSAAANSFTGVFSGGYSWRINDGQGTNPTAGLFVLAGGSQSQTVSRPAFVGINTNAPVSPLDVSSPNNQAAVFRGLGNGASTTTSVVHILTTQVDNASCLALQVGDPNPLSPDNFVTFFNGAGGAMGRIEAVNTTTSAYVTTGADFAETLPVADSAQPQRPAEIVPVHGGKIGDWNNAEHFMVISNQAGFVGNDPGQDVEAGGRHHRIAFLGQVPVKLRGAVSSGDYVLASEANDGTGIARPASKVSVAEMNRVVGRAWESSADEGMKEINTAVGLDQTSLVVPALERLERENRELRARLESLERRLIEQTLPSRLAPSN